MPKSKVRKGVTNFSHAEKIEWARKVDAYRAAHPDGTLDEALIDVRFPAAVPTYYSWRLLAAEEPINGHDHGNGEAVDFPLAIIPAKAAPKPKKKTTPARLIEHDQDKTLAAQLLEVAAALLRR